MNEKEKIELRKWCVSTATHAIGYLDLNAKIIDLAEKLEEYILDEKNKY